RRARAIFAGRTDAVAADGHALAALTSRARGARTARAPAPVASAHRRSALRHTALAVGLAGPGAGAVGPAGLAVLAGAGLARVVTGARVGDALPRREVAGAAVGAAGRAHAAASIVAAALARAAGRAARSPVAHLPRRASAILRAVGAVLAALTAVDPA